MVRSRRQVSQKLIAAEAGVSQATVSLVLSGQAVSSEDTRQRVLQAARRLKYRPNLLVQGIQTGKTRMIGVMAPPFDYYWCGILYGIHDRLTIADHVPITLWESHQGPMARDASASDFGPLEQIHRLLDRRVDGAILWPPFAALYSNHVNEFVSRDLPVVTIDHQLPPELQADFVGCDESVGGRLVAEHLLSLGHRNIGQIAGASRLSWASQRRAAFEAALRAAGDVTCTTLEGPEGGPDPAFDLAIQMLRGKNRPTAIFAATDPYAREVCRAAAELKLRVPEDVSVVGYADDDFAVEMQPQLTTVRQPGYAVGQKAAEIVLGRSEGSIADPNPIVARLPVQLIVRGSTARVR